jgi:putative restriction endonuclease
MDEDDPDTAVRLAAYSHVRKLGMLHDVLTSEHLTAGFPFEGERIPLVNPQRGIFKPRRMRFLLSIRTVFPTSGRRVWYDDQREVHAQIYGGQEAVDYAFMGDDPDDLDAVFGWLAEAGEELGGGGRTTAGYGYFSCKPVKEEEA